MFKFKLLAGGVLAVLLGAGITKVSYSMLQGAPINVLDKGAKGDDFNDDHTAIQNALNAATGEVYVPYSASCYNIGTVGINMVSNKNLRGAGMGGPGKGPSCLHYTGTGCAVTFDSTQAAGIHDIDISTDTTSATARAMCFKTTTGVAEFNIVENVSMRMSNATRRTAGQVGLLMQDTNGNGVFWNTFRRLRTAYWDTSIKLVGGTNGVNANHFDDLMSWGHVTAFRAITANVADNRIYGMHCSRSDGTWAGNATCLLLGDDGSDVFGNKFFDLTSDQGSPSVCGTIGAGGGSVTRANVVISDCQSGGAITDNNTNTTFPTTTLDLLSAASGAKLALGRVLIKADFAQGLLPAVGGAVRLSNNAGIYARNNANNADAVIAVYDTNDRVKIGSTAVQLRLDNNLIEHGTGTVANSGSERFVHAWNLTGRNSANNANRTLLDWGVGTADTMVLGDASMAGVTHPGPSKFTNSVNVGTCTLNAGTPATCTATVTSGAKCLCSNQSSVTNGVKCSVATTTMTATGANGAGDTITYWCPG